MKFIIFTFFTFLTFCRLLAQAPNGPKVTYSQEECNLTTTELQRLICYVTRANVEEKTLIKLGIRPNSLAPFFNDTKSVEAVLNLEIAVEHKIRPSLSVLAALDYIPQYFAYSNLGPGRNSRTFSSQANARFGARYYYSMARRIREGKSANNFSGNYIGLVAGRPVLYQLIRYDYDSQTGQPNTSRHKTPLFRLNQPSVELNWGLQRRLWRLGYLDVSAGPRFTYIGESSMPTGYGKYTAFSFQFNALIGLGW